LNAGRARYVWVTVLPLIFVGIATETAGYQLVTRAFIPGFIRSADAGKVLQGWVLTTICVVSMVALLAIVLELILRIRRRTAAPL
jgi:carbon starvation protein CstA